MERDDCFLVYLAACRDALADRSVSYVDRSLRLATSKLELHLSMWLLYLFMQVPHQRGEDYQPDDELDELLLWASALAVSVDRAAKSLGPMAHAAWLAANTRPRDTRAGLGGPLSPQRARLPRFWSLSDTAVAALKSANARYVEASTPVAGAAEARAMVQASLDLPREVEVGGAIWVENGAVRVAEGGTKLRDLDEELVVLDEMARPYGWLVTFNSRRYAETQDFMDMLIGSGPVIVEAATRRLIHTGSNPSFVDLYEEYRWGTRS